MSEPIRLQLPWRTDAKKFTVTIAGGSEVSLYATPIDPKYQIVAPAPALIVKTTDINQHIPAEEPVILFRARDRLSIRMLHYYRLLAIQDHCTEFHLDGITNRIQAFEQFERDYPDRMKQPGITRGR